MRFSKGLHVVRTLSYVESLWSLARTVAPWLGSAAFAFAWLSMIDWNIAVQLLVVGGLVAFGVIDAFFTGRRLRRQQEERAAIVGLQRATRLVAEKVAENIDRHDRNDDEVRSELDRIHAQLWRLGPRDTIPPPGFYSPRTDEESLDEE